MLSDISKYKNAGIFGMGREGKAVRKFLAERFPVLNIIEIGEENTPDLNRCDIVFKSPGISFYRPEIQGLIKRNIPISSATDLFMHFKNPKQKMIVVTGTKGKSTTSSLLYHTLKHLGVSVGFGGNIGVPLVALLEQNFDWVVAELSSYQCTDFAGQPDIALLLNLYPEHLQWHGTHERYYSDKIHLIQQGKVQIINALDEQTKTYFSQLNNPIFFNIPDGIHVQNGLFMQGEQALFPTTSLNLIGQHNALNACAVLAIVAQMGLDLTACEGAFKTFQSLPHRLEKIGEVKGVTFIDDSISTTPETAVAGLKSFGSDVPITLIAGGQDRGQDYTVLLDFMKTNKDRFQLIAMPDTGHRLFESAQSVGINGYFANTMAQAVEKAKEITLAGGIVLLSPAAPSYNLYRNFEERGADFKKNVFKEP